MIELAVVRFAVGWRILTGALWRGRFEYKVDAVDAALRVASDIDRHGKPVRLLVQDTFGEMRRRAHPASTSRRLIPGLRGCGVLV